MMPAPDPLPPDPLTAPVAPEGDLSARDPLADLSPRQLRSLARRADRLRRRRPDDLVLLAAEAGVSVRRLRLLGDAWAEGGPSGVQAIGPAVRIPPDPMSHAESALSAWHARHHPLEALRWDRWRNRLTVWRLVPDRRRRNVQDLPLLQVRVTHEGRWHLYRRAALGEWWPVVVRGPRRWQTLEDCLTAVERDAGNAFWASPQNGDSTRGDPPEPPRH